MRAVFERYLTPADEKRLLAEVALYASVLARRDLEWMVLLGKTGIRVSSLSLLSVGDARAALSSNYLVLSDEISKGGRGYKVFLVKRAQLALRRLLRIRKEMGAGGDFEAPLIMSRNHQGMSVRSFQSRMQRWVKMAGLDVKASPHWWRHTVAKRLMKNSAADDPRGVVMGVLGHASVVSTSIYTMPDREDIEAEMVGAL